MVYFENAQDLLNSFYHYMDQREPITLWRTKNYDIVLKPPSFVDWARWLTTSQIEGWENANFKVLKLLSTQDEYRDAFNEVMAAMEADVVANSLVGNYSPTFAQQYLKQKFNWDRLEIDDSKIVVVGLDAIADMLPEVPNVTLPK